MSTLMKLSSVVFYKCPRESPIKSDLGMDDPYFNTLLNDTYVMYSSIYNYDSLLTVSDSE